MRPCTLIPILAVWLIAGLSPAGPAHAAEGSGPWTRSAQITPTTRIAVRAMDGSPAPLQSSAVEWLTEQSRDGACQVAPVTAPDRFNLTCPGRRGATTYAVTRQRDGGLLVTSYRDRTGGPYTGGRLLDQFSGYLEGFERQ